jgi:hypothetical protein
VAASGGVDDQGTHARGRPGNVGGPDSLPRGSRSEARDNRSPDRWSKGGPCRYGLQEGTMPDAWTPENMSPGLLKVAERAKRDPQGRFHSLAHLIDEAALARAYTRLRKEAAVGEFRERPRRLGGQVRLRRSAHRSPGRVRVHAGSQLRGGAHGLRPQPLEGGGRRRAGTGEATALAAAFPAPPDNSDWTPGEAPGKRKPPGRGARGRGCLGSIPARYFTPKTLAYR